MTISWSTIGKSDPPIRGIPSEFDSVSSTFDTIKQRTRSLTEELREIRLGEADGFQGSAADAFCKQIERIDGTLRDVPPVASNISRIFQSHSHSLTALKKEAGAALGRAQTRWNDKCSAESDMSSNKASLRSIKRQLSALSGDPGEASERARLQSRESSLRHQLGRAHRRFDDANDRLDDSRDEWERLRKDEDELNDRTSRSLRGLELLSLADPGIWDKAKDFVGNFSVSILEGIEAVWESISVELLTTLHEILSSIVEVLDWAGLVLDFIPGVNAVFKAIELGIVATKALVGLGLVAKGAMSWAAWASDTALDVVGLIPGVPKAVIKPLAKVASNVASKAAKKLNIGSNIVDKTVKNVIKNVRGMTTTVARTTRSMGSNLGRRVEGFFERSAEASYRRRMAFAWRRYQMRTPGTGYQRKFLDVERRPVVGRGPKPFSSEHVFAAENAASAARLARERLIKTGRNMGAVPKSGWRTLDYSWDMAGALNLDDGVIEPIYESLVTVPVPVLVATGL